MNMTIQMLFDAWKASGTHTSKGGLKLSRIQKVLDLLKSHNL